MGVRFWVFCFYSYHSIDIWPPFILIKYQLFYCFPSVCNVPFFFPCFQIFSWFYIFGRLIVMKLGVDVFVLFFFFILCIHLASRIYIDGRIPQNLRNFQSLFLKIFFSAPFSPSLLQSGILTGLDSSAHFLPNHFSLHYLDWVISIVSSSPFLLHLQSDFIFI